MIFPCESVLVNLDNGGKNMGHKSKHITEVFWVRPQEPPVGAVHLYSLDLGGQDKGEHNG